MSPIRIPLIASNSITDYVPVIGRDYLAIQTAAVLVRKREYGGLYRILLMSTIELWRRRR